MSRIWICRMSCESESLSIALASTAAIAPAPASEEDFELPAAADGDVDPEAVVAHSHCSSLPDFDVVNGLHEFFLQLVDVGAVALHVLDDLAPRVTAQLLEH